MQGKNGLLQRLPQGLLMIHIFLQWIGKLGAGSQHR